MLYLRWLVNGFSVWRPSFNMRAAHVGFVVNTVALEDTLLQAFQFCSAAIFPPVLHTHIHPVLAPVSIYSIL
jgi:hypothetical protein